MTTRPVGQAVTAQAPDAAEVRDGARPMRADAIKNRQRILEAAEATFASLGLSVPIDTVAERAGVGVGTLYRHFPTKEALFEAIVMTRLEELLDETRMRADADDPADALFSFLQHFAAQASAKQDLFDAMNAAGFDIKSACAESMDEMKQGIDVLIARAKAVGAVRVDVTSDEVLGLIVGACNAARHSASDNSSCQRMVQIVCDGIRSPAQK
jgi:AcrR family transcriptional regulator